MIFAGLFCHINNQNACQLRGTLGSTHYTFLTASHSLLHRFPLPCLYAEKQIREPHTESFKCFLRLLPKDSLRERTQPANIPSSEA